MTAELEGGQGQITVVEYLARHDISVCAHLGLRLQSVHKIGGFRLTRWPPPHDGNRVV
jgi:3-methyl-2-oxobutanoate hydroxymethyltransferase